MSPLRGDFDYILPLRTFGFEPSVRRGILEVIIMTFSERMKDLLEQGWTASKEFAIKAGEKAQDLGERGILMWDIKQLENQAQKLISRLGGEAYVAFTERSQTTIDKGALEFRIILDEIALIKDQIEKKEFELKNR